MFSENKCEVYLIIFDLFINFFIFISLSCFTCCQTKKMREKKHVILKIHFLFVWISLAFLALIDTLDRKSLVCKWCISDVLIVVPSMHLWRIWQPYNRWCQRETGNMDIHLPHSIPLLLNVSAQCIMSARCKRKLLGFRCRIEQKNHRSTCLNIIIEHKRP